MVLTYISGICYVVRSTGKVAFAFLFFKFPYFWFPNFIGVLPGVTRCRCKELECGSTPLKKGGGSVANGATRSLVFNNITSLFSFALINFGFERLKLPKFIT